MRKILTITIILAIFIFNSNNIFAQEKVKIVKKEFKTNKKGKGKAFKNIKYGDHYYKEKTEGSYLKALHYYLAAADYNSENPELNYKIGICYLESIHKNKALNFLQKSFEAKEKVAGDIMFHLARAYHFNYMFSKAITYYQNYINILPDNSNKLANIDKKIQECKNGIELMKDTTLAFIRNVTIVNTEAKDYSPLITADGSKMFFTSRRQTSTGGQINPFDNQYYEDIFLAEKIDNSWKAPKNVGLPLNTPNHDATVGLSYDGQTLITFFYGDLYISKLKGEKWSNPDKLPKEINSSEIETSACFSIDNNTLYFVRGMHQDPDKSNGDIYFSNRNEKGKWTEAKKISDVINTPYDEDGIYMLPDGKTIYFSSKGHNSMGGYDVFKTILQQNGTWSAPENLGYPINTPDDDIYFVLEASEKTGYYSAIREDSKGFNDIYQIIYLNNKLVLNSEDNLIASITKPTSEENIDKSTRVTLVKGIVLDKNTGKPIEAIIEIIDNETNEVVYRTTSNSATGEYIVSLPPGKNYGMAIKKDGYLFHSENFDLVEDEGGYKEVKQDVQMETIEENSKITLKNIFFDTGRSEIKEASFSELNIAVEFMNQNPDIKVEIQGHTDNQGGEETNKTLSQARANAVVEYLVEKGIVRNRLKPVGYWYKVPLTTNDTREGRRQNRRVEFKIIE